MHNRYNDPEMSVIWDEDQKYDTWFDVEHKICEIHAHLKNIPSDVPYTMATLKEACLSNGYIQKIEEIENTTKHDIIAFLTHLSNVIGEPAKYIHYGMTSQDLIDTSQAILINKSIHLILERLSSLCKSLRERALQYQHTLCVGRSHGIHAEPMTFGLKLLSHYTAFKRCYDNLLSDVENIVRIKCSGAIGTYSMMSPTVEEMLSSSLGIKAETISTQVVPRDRHALLFSHLSIIASCIERFAVEIRHLQRTEVGEIIESFAKGQKGSSAMPHKKNPILTENLTGLARIIRMSLIPAMENVALWHERDISHSSAERVILGDTFVHLSFALKRTLFVVDNFILDEQQMLNNLNKTGGLIYSQRVLLYLIKEKNYTREKAYEVVQSAAHDNEYFKASLKDQRILNDDELKELFNPKQYTQYIDYIFNKCLHEY